MRQLPLGVQLGVSLRFETFHAGRERRGGRRAAASRGRRRHRDAALDLRAPRAAARATCCRRPAREAGARGLTAAWLPLAPCARKARARSTVSRQLDLVALDDVDAVAGHAAWEARALHVLQRHAASAVAGSRSRRQRRRRRLPSGCPTSPRASARPQCIASRRSRRRSRPRRCGRRAAQRGLELPDETLTFLTRRAPRDFAALCRLLDELDTRVAGRAAPPDGAVRARLAARYGG